MMMIIMLVTMIIMLVTMFIMLMKMIIIIILMMMIIVLMLNDDGMGKNTEVDNADFVAAIENDDIII